MNSQKVIKLTKFETQEVTRLCLAVNKTLVMDGKEPVLISKLVHFLLQKTLKKSKNVDQLAREITNRKVINN